MKIVAGLGSIDEYERFIQAGADEFFAGYVPYDWSRAYGTVIPFKPAGGFYHPCAAWGIQRTGDIG